MVDPSLLPAIREALKQNEIGNGSPYCLSYARFGASGASFGIFQADTNTNHLARDVLRQALAGSGAPQATIDRIVAAVSQACPDGSPLESDDADLADNALASARGRALVDAMDQRTLDIVLSEVDDCIAAAARNNLRIEPVALVYIALWVNMTGAPKLLCQWLGGTPELGLAPPTGQTVTQHNIEAYLQASTFFRVHPRNFVHMQESVRAALVPA